LGHCDATVDAGESIQDAIDAADPGHTICVAAGTFEEDQASFRDMFIDKSLNLIGAGSGQTIVGLSQGKTNGVEIRGENITDILIEGFTFTRRDGADHASNFNLRFGETATTFDSLVLRDVEVAWAKGRNVALDVNGTYHGVVIEHSNFHTSGAWGFSARGVVDSMHVEESRFDDNGWDNPAHGIGFDIDVGTQAQNISVIGGSFSNNTSKGINLTNLKDSTFTGVTANDNTQAIVLYEWRGASENIIIAGCTAHGNAQDGVFIGRQENFTIDHVTVDGCNLQNNSRTGLFTWVIVDTAPASTGIEILNSHFEQNQRGIWLEMPTNGLTVSDNVVLDSALHGITVFDANATIEGNTVRDSAFSGIIVLGSQGVTIENNIVEDNVEAGILAGTSTNVSILGNTIQRNSLSAEFNRGGVNLFGDLADSNVNDNRIADNGDAGIWVEPGSGAGNAAHGNCIEGNAAGAFNNSPNVLDATDNWWGDASGPSDEGPGTGDSVSANVDFDPWLTGGCPLDPPPPPPDPETRADCMRGGWQDYGFENQGHCLQYVKTGVDNR
jgi:parallel beta-helix repeat protein